MTKTGKSSIVTKDVLIRENELLIKRFLKSIIILSDKEYKVLIERMNTVTCDKNVKLNTIGETEKSIYLVIKGLVKKSVYRGAEEVVIQFAKEGDIACPSSSFFLGTPSKCDFEAIECSVIYSIRKTTLDSLTQQYPRLKDFYLFLITKVLLQKESVEAVKTWGTGRDRFALLMEKNGDLIQRVRQKSLASYLNVTQETFSRLKKDYYKKRSKK